jgi:hypothetical protein
MLCAFCIILAPKWPKSAITTLNGHAVCEDHVVSAVEDPSFRAAVIKLTAEKS